mmetsp:Transcript_89158/g.279267  ORF Transcript_89158/g.279267 Transcript_89158/m.279267 type:complete len:252 (-) Transcript_89158:15-770(-)
MDRPVHGDSDCNKSIRSQPPAVATAKRVPTSSLPGHPSPGWPRLTLPGPPSPGWRVTSPRPRRASRLPQRALRLRRCQPRADLVRVSAGAGGGAAADALRLLVERARLLEQQHSHHPGLALRAAPRLQRPAQGLQRRLGARAQAPVHAVEPVRREDGVVASSRSDQLRQQGLVDGGEDWAPRHCGGAGAPAPPLLHAADLLLLLADLLRGVRCRLLLRLGRHRGRGRHELVAAPGDRGGARGGRDARAGPA